MAARRQSHLIKHAVHGLSNLTGERGLYVEGGSEFQKKLNNYFKKLIFVLVVKTSWA